MHYIVDGHNLIGHSRTIRLTDPDDEAQLTDALHRWVLRNKRARITVVFDGGVYGHPLRLDRPNVRTVFARSPQDADTRLIALIQAIAEPQAFRIVTSDRMVAAVAKAHGLQVIDSAQFAAELEQPSKTRHNAARKQRTEPKLPRTEVEAWLRLFGEEPPTAD